MNYLPFKRQVYSPDDYYCPSNAVPAGANGILPKYLTNRTALNMFPLTLHMGGPRAAIWHCLFR